jgi:UPF0755 protein
MDLSSQPIEQETMVSSWFTKTRIAIGVILLFLVICIAAAMIWFVHELSPAGVQSAPQTVFEITQGEGFREVAGNLQNDHFIRSSSAFDIFALFGGHALTLRPGLYHLNASMTTNEILNIISGGNAATALVTIPEGSNIFEVDVILSKALVIHSGDLVRLQASDVAAGGNGSSLEGKLFPDTYEFYTNADVKDVVGELLDNFAAKAQTLLIAGAGKNATNTIILASILEKEVPSQADQKIVAGIILKRVAARMPINIDATVCYAKLLAENGVVNGTTSEAVSGTGIGGSIITGCPSLTALDFKVKSPYNSYLYGGLPPGPIGNPGLSSITAALHPQSSPYWYYLSDPKTGKTVFAKTLDEQTQNRVKYLESE